MHAYTTDSSHDLAIGGIRVRIGTTLTEKLIEQMNKVIYDGTFRIVGTFSSNSPTKLCFDFADGTPNWSEEFTAEYMIELHRLLERFFDKQSDIQLHMPDGDEFIYAPDGSYWCFYSASSNIQYDNADDLAGMHRE